jgi:hypothetical protein
MVPVSENAQGLTVLDGQDIPDVPTVALRMLPYLSMLSDLGWPGLEERERTDMGNLFADLRTLSDRGDVGWRALVIRSKKHGIFHVLLDAQDYDRVVAAGKWNICPQGTRYSNTYYARKTVVLGDGTRVGIRMHNFILGINGVDHINGDGLDNRRQNLRAATHAENLQNRRLGSDNTSGHRGVSWRSQTHRWRAYITVRGVRISLGDFKELKDAADAARAARALHFPYVNEKRSR